VFSWTVVFQNPETTKNEEEDNVVDYEEAAKPGFNIFRTTLARITSGRELTLIYDGITRLLWNVHESGNTLAPGATKPSNVTRKFLSFSGKCWMKILSS